MTTLSGAAIVVRALEDEGIPYTFGIPGTHNIELYDALAESRLVEAVLVTDEQSAGFMADAVWRASRKLACACLVPGAGLTHALSGIAEAFLDTVPMLVLGCGIRRDTTRAFQLHDIDQLAVARPVTKATFRPEGGASLYGTIRRACRIAREGTPGPVMVEVPADLYLHRHDVAIDAARPEAGASEPLHLVQGGSAGARAAETPPSSSGSGRAAPVADAARAAALAAELLRDVRRPLIYAGLGAQGAAAQLRALSERLEAPVASTFQGKGVYPETYPLWLWPGFGTAAPDFARDVVAGCDATIAIGCRFGEVATASYGVEPPRPLIHVDIDPAVPGRNFPADLAAAVDARAFLDALLPLLEQRARDDRLRERIRAGHEDVQREWAEDAGPERVSPYHLLRALQERLGPETVFTSDSGNGTFLAMELLRLVRPGHFLAPVDYSCMGYAVPAAIGAKLARPEAPVVALAGDGAFLMTGLELLTASHLGVPVAVFALRDRELAQIAQFQQVAMNRKANSELPDYDLSAICEGLGVDCVELGTDAELHGVIDSVLGLLRQGRPVVVDVAIDYSRKTYFTRGVVKTTLNRLPWPDRLRFVGRAIGRRLLGG